MDSRTLRRFLFSFLPLAAAVLLLAWGFVLLQDGSRLTRRQEQTASLVATERALIEQTLGMRLRDALFLRDLAAMHEREAQSDPAAMEELAREMALFAGSRGSYDQVRFLSPSGMEMIRVNQTPDGPHVVPSEGLQNKSGRYYFQEALRVRPGRIYVSPMDLNVEGGKVEEPRKPMVRIGAPVHDDRGRLLGVVVLNYLAEQVLRPVMHRANRVGGRLYLLNPEGWYLLGPSVDREWAFMYEGRDEGRFFHDHPQAWERMHGRARGQFLLDKTLYTFESACPLALVETMDAVPEEGVARECWRVVSVLPAEHLVYEWKGLFRLGTAGLLVFLALISWALARSGAARERAVQDLRESEMRIRAIGESTLDAIIMIDPQGLVRYWNPAATLLFGYSDDEVMGRALHDIVVPPEQRQEAHAGFAHFQETGEGSILYSVRELRALKRDGSVVPIELSVAPIRLKGRMWAVGNVRDITQRKEYERRLKELATTDSLTGLANRRRFLEFAESELERSERYGHSLALLMVDADKFKDVNDTYGHDVGDEVLKALAGSLEESVREVDLPARIGGEEFAVLLPETGSKGAAKIAERIRKAVEALTVSALGREVRFTVSVGVSVVEGGGELEALIKAADRALYQAKENGRNRVEMG